MNNQSEAIKGMGDMIQACQQEQTMAKHHFGMALSDMVIQLNNYNDYDEAIVVADIEQHLNELKRLASEIATANRTIANYEAAVSAIKANQ